MDFIKKWHGNLIKSMYFRKNTMMIFLINPKFQVLKQLAVRHERLKYYRFL